MYSTTASALERLAFLFADCFKVLRNPGDANIGRGTCRNKNVIPASRLTQRDNLYGPSFNFAEDIHWELQPETFGEAFNRSI